VHPIKGYGGFSVQLHPFFTTALDRGGQLKGSGAFIVGNRLAVPVQ
jgi:hypothetical protein